MGGGGLGGDGGQTVAPVSVQARPPSSLHRPPQLELNLIATTNFEVNPEKNLGQTSTAKNLLPSLGCYFVKTHF